MLVKKETEVAGKRVPRDPFALLRDMAPEFDRWFDEINWPTFRLPSLRLNKPLLEGAVFTPAIDVFEKDNKLVTRVDLPGMKKEDVKVEIGDGYLTISGERKTEIDEKKDDFYRWERGYGKFLRTVPLPDDVKFEDIKAQFADGVLEVTVPLPAKAKAEVRAVPIEEPVKPTKAA